VVKKVIVVSPRGFCAGVVQLVHRVLAWFPAHRVTDIRSSASSDEDVSFKLPRELVSPPVRRASLALT
jgi:hypothetical protein